MAEERLATTLAAIEQIRLQMVAAPHYREGKPDASFEHAALVYMTLVNAGLVF